MEMSFWILRGQDSFIRRPKSASWLSRFSLPAYICLGYAESEAMPLLGRASLAHRKELRQEEGNNGEFFHGH